LTLAVAIGAVTSIFSLVDSIILLPLPYPESDRLVVIHNSYNGNHASNSVPDYFDRVTGNTTLDTAGAFRSRDFSLTTAANDPRFRRCKSPSLRFSW
jgi:hypothetical protein